MYEKITYKFAKDCIRSELYENECDMIKCTLTAKLLDTEFKTTSISFQKGDSYKSALFQLVNKIRSHR